MNEPPEPGAKVQSHTESDSQREEGLCGLSRDNTVCRMSNFRWLLIWVLFAVSMERFRNTSLEGEFQ